MGAKNLPDKTTDKIPQPHGGALNPGGTLGNSGGGRPSTASRIRYETLLADPEHWKYVEEISQGKHGAKEFQKLHITMIDRTEGKVPQPVQVQGDPDRPLEVVYRNEFPK